MNPNFDYVYNSLALALYESDKKNAQRVVELLNTGIGYHPDSFTLWFNIAIVLFQNGAMGEAQKAIAEAEKNVKKVWEYQMLTDSIKHLQEGRMDNMKMLFLQLPTAKG